MSLPHKVQNFIISKLLDGTSPDASLALSPLHVDGYHSHDLQHDVFEVLKVLFPGCELLHVGMLLLADVHVST